MIAIEKKIFSARYMHSKWNRFGLVYNEKNLIQVNMQTCQTLILKIILNWDLINRSE